MGRAGGSVGLFLIARAASSHDIGPGFRSLFGSGNYMVQGQTLCRMPDTTVLAGEVVPNVDIFPTKSNGTELSGTNIIFQAHDRWQLEAVGYRPGENLVIFDDLNFALEPQYQGLLPRHDFHWFEAGVQKK